MQLRVSRRRERSTDQHGRRSAGASLTKPSEDRSGSDAATVVERRETDARSVDVETSIRTSHVVLTEEIGRGGMGVIFRGEQVDLARAIAFKQLPSDSNETQRARFLREARITAQLDHPNVVPVHFLEPGTPAGYVMKLVEGKTLRALLHETIDAYERGDVIDAEHALPSRLEHFLKICDALAFAHSKGILHRDLKPANVMIGKFGEVYVMDWGIARRLGTEDSQDTSTGASTGSDEALTRVGAVMGSPTYMSPEQAEGRNEDLDARSDQYALGLLLFEIVSLRRAIRASSSVTDAVASAAQGDKVPLEHVSAKERIPIELRAIVEKATARRPADRYPSVGALAEDVRRAMRGDAVVARPDRPFSKLLRWMSKHRRTTLAVVVSALALAAVVASWTQVRKKGSELVARERGERRTALYIDAAAQGHRIDAQFQRMEAALEGLRTAAEWALSNPDSSSPSSPIYFDVDFADPDKRPRDFTDRSAYRWPVSVDFPVVGIAPGVNREAVTPKVRKLIPLNEHMRAMFVDAATDGHAVLTPEQQRDIVLQRLGPIDYAYVDLAEGVHDVYPGMNSLPEGYDVRSSSFYRISDHRHGKHWGAPYVDATTDVNDDDLVLPCTEGLWSREGEFLGVAGVEFTVAKIVAKGLALPVRKTLRTSLLDDEGHKVIDSNDAKKRFRTSGKDEAVVLEDFDIPDVVRAIHEGTEGLREVQRAGRDEVVAFVKLDVRGWYYVVEVDAASL